MFNIQSDISFLTVFAEGLLSFFSPCVLPLLPLYIGYLSGGAAEHGDSGEVRYGRGRVMVNTFFFILGISAAFFLLGLGFTALGRFFSGNRLLFARISGVIIILFGLYQLGLFGSSGSLSRERRLPLSVEKLTMNPLTALILGFTFSFAWTPCVGPTLSSVLLMAGSSSSAAAGFALIGAYTLGFVLPFILTGLFAGTLLNFFSRHMSVLKYTAKAAGVIMIAMGIMVLTGRMNSITTYLSGVTASEPSRPETSSSSDEPKNGEPEATEPAETPDDGEDEPIPAPDFELVDQYGYIHRLSDYQGKTVFLNFWATWCPPCRAEMPDIQAIYEKYGMNGDELVVLGVCNPRTDENPRANDVPADEVASFMEENGYTYPTLMDESGRSLSEYGISAFPTTFMIAPDGSVFGYVTGGMSADVMESIIRQTMTGVRE